MSDPKPRRIPDWVSFLLAFLAGYVTAWAVQFYSIIGIFMGPGKPAASAFLLLPLFPLAGLAVFQLLFGMTGRWRGWQFWAIATPVVYAILLATAVPILQNLISQTAGTILCGGLLILAGFWALALTKPAD